MITFEELASIVLAVLMIIKIIIRLTPSKKDDSWFIKLMKMVDNLWLPDVQGSKKKKEK